MTEVIEATILENSMSMENGCIKIVGEYPSDLEMRDLKKFLNDAKALLGEQSILTLFYSHNNEQLKCGIQINYSNDSYEEAYFSSEGRSVSDALQHLLQQVTTYAIALERTKAMAATVSEFSSPCS
jgi:hypothetical protein